MKRIITFSLLALLFACESNENNENEPCTKQIIIQNEFIIQSPSGTTIIPEITQEVDCDFPEPDVAETIKELPQLNEFSYDILDITVISDTGNNTSKVSYSIRLNNLSNTSVKGIPYVTTRVNNQSFTASSPNTSNCLELNANSSCIISFEAEESLNIGIISSYEVVNVQYLIFQ